MTAIFCPAPTAKYSVCLANIGSPAAAEATGSAPTVTKQSASVVQRTNFVPPLKAFPATEAAPTLNSCRPKGGSVAIGPTAVEDTPIPEYSLTHSVAMNSLLLSHPSYHHRA